MADYTCAFCEKKFSDDKRVRKYCSVDCVYKQMRESTPEEHISFRGAKIKLKCSWCKKEFVRFKSNVKQIKGNYHFCSDGCYRQFNIGKKHPNWKGGRHKTSDGYISVVKRNHPCATVRGTVLEHRLVAESCLGRYLKPREVIHHINENTIDNRPKNLYLFGSEVKHKKHHRSGGKIISNLLQKFI